MAHNYDVGTRAWQPDPTEGWLASEVNSKKIQGDKVTLVFELVNGDVSGPMAGLGPLIYTLIVRGIRQELLIPQWRHYTMTATASFPHS